MTRPLSPAATRTVSPSLTVPFRISVASGFCSERWITRFSGRALGDPAPSRWRVARDGGDFPQFAGATLTPRAVVAAVRRALQFVATHGEAVRAAEAGATLSFDDAPADPPPAR